MRRFALLALVVSGVAFAQGAGQAGGFYTADRCTSRDCKVRTLIASYATSGNVAMSIPGNTYLDFGGTAPGGAPGPALRYNTGVSGLEFNGNFFTLAAGGVGFRADHYAAVGGTQPELDMGANIPAGQKLCLNVGCTRYIYDDGTRIQLVAPEKTYFGAGIQFDNGLLVGSGGITASASGSFDMSGSSNAFKTTTGAVTLGGAGNAITANGDTKFAAAKNRGTIVLSAGSGTATVVSGALCMCQDTTTPRTCGMSVSGTTGTCACTSGAAETATYWCF